MANSEYSRLRSIARKRIERLSEAGFAPKIHIPTVKELKQSGGSIEKATASIKSFLASGQTVKQARVENSTGGNFRFEFKKEGFEKPKRKELTEAQKEHRRQQARIRRMMAGAWGLYGKDERILSYAKGLKTMGISIPPSMLPAYADYIEQRLSQGENIARKYFIYQYAEDFQTLTKGMNYKPDKILTDFNQYASDQAILRTQANNFHGTSSLDMNDMWDRFIESRR